MRKQDIVDSLKEGLAEEHKQGLVHLATSLQSVLDKSEKPSKEFVMIKTLIDTLKSL